MKNGGLRVTVAFADQHSRLNLWYFCCAYSQPLGFLPSAGSYRTFFMPPASGC